MEYNVHGCLCLRPFGLVFFLVLTAAPGCEGPPFSPPEIPAGPSPDTAIEFDPATAGTIRGRVIWDGDLPEVPPLVDQIQVSDDGIEERIIYENPNAPVIDPQTRGVAGAVVFLRGIDPRRGRPWDHPPVRVEARDLRLHVLQGGTDSRIGFVRRGDSFEMVSRQEAFHALRADGAAFFTLAFPDPESPLQRRLERRGLVELSSGASHYWMRAYLFVDDHPYYTRTDAEGRFTLPQVPPGRYQAVCWLPCWHREHLERNPDSGAVVRWFFRPPVERARPVTLGAGEVRDLEFAIPADPFGVSR